jgi:heat-inducible transcriptional repressor
VGFFDDALADIDEILRGTTHLLSRLTRYASLALAPSPREAAIVRAELITLGSGSLLLLVFDNGRIEKGLIDVPRETAVHDVEQVSRSLMEAFSGKTVSAARAEARERARSGAETERALFARIGDSLHAIEEAAESEHLFMGGVSNIAADAAFDRRETLRQIYETLETESAMLLLLRQAAAEPVAVMIGRENPLPDLWQASVIAAPYGAGGGALGTIGVVGPIRMDYGAAISAVRAVAERLSAAVEALHG